MQPLIAVLAVEAVGGCSAGTVLGPHIGSARGSRRRRSVADPRVSTAQLVNQHLGFSNVPAKTRCLGQRRPAAAARPHVFAFNPKQLTGHLLQLVAQCADQLRGLEGLAIRHP